MYQLIAIEESEVTRMICLKNLLTDVIDDCFDDSAVTSFENFEFMEVDDIYDCKIYLLGKISDDGETFNIVGKVNIGMKELLEVSDINNNTYYIENNRVDQFSRVSSFKFKYTRKDIIQVNDIIHPDFKYMTLKDKLFKLLKDYNNHEIDSNIFTNEFMKIFDLEIDYDDLTEKEYKILGEVSDMSARFSDSENDLKLPNAYYSEKQIREITKYALDTLIP